MATAIFQTDFDYNSADPIRAKSRASVLAYAAKIGAQFVKIATRNFPEFGDLYEKMQVHELGAGNEFNIFVEWDTILASTMIDMPKECPADSVGHWGAYGASSWFELEDFFKDDLGEPIPLPEEPCPTCTQLWTPPIPAPQPRDIAFADHILCVPKACHDVWKPTELPYEVAVSYAGRKDWVSQWNLARNLAANHFKAVQFQSVARKLGAQDDSDSYIVLDVARKQRDETKAEQLAAAYSK